MTTVQLPLYLDRGHFDEGVKNHPRLVKRLNDLTNEIYNCTDPDLYFELEQERQEILEKIVS